MKKSTIKNGLKICTKCKKEKVISFFGYTKDDRYRKSYIDSNCKACRKNTTYLWRKLNPYKNSLIDIRHSLKLKIGVISNYGKK